MTDNFLDDDFGRKPGAPRPDYDAELADFKRTTESTPDEVHNRHYDEAQAFLNNSTAREVFSEKRAAVLVDDPEDVRKIHQAAAETAAEAAKKESEKAPAQNPGENPAAPTDSAVSNDANSAAAAAPGASSQSAADALQKQGAEKPTALESTLSNIRMSPERQQRLIIAGDPAIERRFYDKLAERGDVYYQGGTPIITLSRAKAIKLLHETAAEMSGAKSAHAMSLKLDRDGGGVIGSIKAGLANNLPSILGRRHEIDVVVVGTPEVVSDKLKELGGLITSMERNGHVKEGVARVEEGKLVLSEDKQKVPEPVKLDGTARLYDVVSAVKDKVDAYRMEQSELQKQTREFRDQKEQKAMLDAKEKANDGAGNNRPERVNKHAAELADLLDKKFQDGNLLHTQNSKGQVEALALLQQARGLKDPTERELQTLPDGARQKAIVQMTALVAKIDNKEFDAKLGKELDKHKADTSSIRQKVDAYVAMEAKRDPDFQAKAEVLMKDLVDRHLISEKVAEALSSKIGDAVAVAKAESEKDMPKEAAKSESGSASAGESTLAQQSGSTSGSVSTESSKETASGSAANTSAELGTSVTGTALSKETSVSNTENADVKSQSTGPAAESAAPSSDAGASKEATSTTGSTLEAHAQSGTVQASESKAAATESSVAKDAESASTGQSLSKTQSENQPSSLAANSGVQPGTESASSKTTSGHISHTSTDTSSASTVRTEPAAEKPLELRDRIEALSKEGPGKLTEDKAHALVAELDAIRTKPLTALDSNSGDKPTQTLARVDSLLKEMESGRLGSELKALSKDLAEPLQKWTQQDAMRSEADTSRQQGSRSESGTSTDAKALHSEAPVVAKPESGAASQPAPAAQVAREQAAQRLWETETAGGKLSMLMANPAGSFTNRDKSWNQENIQRAAGEVMRLDPDSVSQLSSTQRTKIAVYAAWVAENARDGKLPGFSSEEGKAQAAQLVSRAAALIGKMDDGVKLPAEVQKSVDKADRMVSSMAQLEKSASLSNQATLETSSRSAISPAAANALARDMVDSVYRQGEMSESQAKYLLKNATNLTPDALKSMDPQAQAKTAVAMSHLAQQVRDGAMGDYSKLPASVQKNVTAANNAADNLLTSMNKDPAMRAELNQAYSELTAKHAAATQSASNTHSLSAGNAAAAPAPSKSEGRSHDR